MKSMFHKRTSIICVLLAAALVFPACKPKTKTDESATAAVPDPSKLIASSPRGAVDPFPQPGKKEDELDHSKIVLPGGVTQQELLDRLEIARKEASPDQAQLIERQLSLLKTFNPNSVNEEMLQKVVKESVELMMDYSEMHEDNFDVQLDVASAMFTSGFTTKYAGVDGEEYKRRGKELSQRLVERFPDRAPAYAQLAYVHYQLEEDELAKPVITRCLEVDAENQFCKILKQKIAERAGKNTPKK